MAGKTQCGETQVLDLEGRGRLMACLSDVATTKTCAVRCTGYPVVVTCYRQLQAPLAAVRTPLEAPRIRPRDSRGSRDSFLRVFLVFVDPYPCPRDDGRRARTPHSARCSQHRAHLQTPLASASWLVAALLCVSDAGLRFGRPLCLCQISVSVSLSVAVVRGPWPWWWWAPWAWA